MRIIGGEHRGRRIAAPPGRATRPMLDRVREAVFSTLAPRIAGAGVLDLFAGSGSLGLEALSRGASEARFVERDRRTAALLSRNVRELGLEARAEVVVGDALAPASWGEGAPGVVFLDPPYALVAEPRTRGRVLAALSGLRAACAPGGLVVLHVPRGLLRAADLPDGSRWRDYGTNAIWYVERSAAADGPLPPDGSREERA